VCFAKHSLSAIQIGLAGLEAQTQPSFHYFLNEIKGVNTPLVQYKLGRLGLKHRLDPRFTIFCFFLLGPAQPVQARLDPTAQANDSTGHGQKTCVKCSHMLAIGDG